MEFLVFALLPIGKEQSWALEQIKSIISLLSHCFPCVLAGLLRTVRRMIHTPLSNLYGDRTLMESCMWSHPFIM